MREEYGERSMDGELSRDMEREGGVWREREEYGERGRSVEGEAGA